MEHQEKIFITAADDAMSPRILIGDLLEIDPTVPISDGNIVAITVEGSTTLRRIYKSADGYELIPNNSKHNIIHCKSLCDVLIGRVVQGYFTKF